MKAKKTISIAIGLMMIFSICISNTLAAQPIANSNDSAVEGVIEPNKSSEDEKSSDLTVNDEDDIVEENNSEPKKIRNSSSDLTSIFNIVWSSFENGTLNSDKDGVDLNPVTNTLQTGVLNLEFSLGNIKEAKPGEIIIRIPQHIFYDRDGNGTGEYNIPLKESPSEEGATGFNYKLEDGYIVMTNYKTISDSYLFTTDLKYTYLPSNVKNGYTNKFNASVEVNSEGIIFKKNSNSISLKVNTAADLTTLTKVASKQYDNWPSFLSDKPTGADDYFYVVWEVYNYRSYPTQPYEISFKEELSDGGEVIGYSSSKLGNVNDFIACDTSEFNNNYKVIINIPSSSHSNSLSNGNYNYTYIYTKYPKSAIQSNGNDGTKKFKNDLTATLKSKDGIVKSLTASAEYEYRETTIDESYPGDSYNASKAMSPKDVSGGINKLEKGSKISINTTLNASSRIHSITNNGSGSARLEIVDTGLRFNSPSADLTKGEDYIFTGFKINSMEEYDYRTGENGSVWNSVVNTDYVNHEEINIYYTVKDSDEWKFGGSIERTASSGFIYKDQNGTITTLGSNGYVPLPEEAANVKAVHNSKYFYSSFSVAFQMHIMPSANIINNLANIKQVQFVNNAKLEVFDNNSETVSGNSSCTSYGTLYRFSQSGYMSKTCYDQTTDVGKGQESVWYNVVQYNTTSYDNNIYSLDEVKEMGIVSEQKEGVFYDLLPAGMSVDKDTITVKTYHVDGYLYGDNCSYTLDMVSNWRDSGRTMMKVYVKAPTDENYYSSTTVLSSGFRLNYKVNYSWSSIRDYGNVTFNAAAYYSQSGNLPGGYADTGAYFNSPNKEYFADLDEDSNTDSMKTNVMYAQCPTAFNPITATEAGFTKTVSKGAENEFAKNIQVEAADTYTYKLRFETTINAKAKNIIMYDVLESRYGSSDYWKGEFQSIDLSQPKSKGITPKVYYSTRSGLNTQVNEAHRDLSDSTIWSTSKPDNNSDITAVAIDLTKGSRGEYIFSAGESAVCNIILRAPSNYQDYTDTYAYNDATIDSTIINANTTEMRSIENTYPTTVGLKAAGIAINKKSDPESGTKSSPTEIEPDDNMNYYIKVSNNSSTEAKNNIKLEDTLSDILNIDSANIKYYLDENQTSATFVEGSDEVSVNITGQKLEFNIKTLPAGAVVTFIIPTSVNSDALQSHDPYDIKNTADITGFNGQSYIIKSETTYHQVKLPKPLDFEKLKINKSSNPESGTEMMPTDVSFADDIYYNIGVKNTSDNSTYLNVKVKDIIPDELKIKVEDIQCYLDNNEENAVLISTLENVSVEVDDQKLIFTIKKFQPGEEIHFIIPTIVDEDSITNKGVVKLDEDLDSVTVVMENTAYIIEASGEGTDIKSETTYHKLEYTNTPENPAFNESEANYHNAKPKANEEEDSSINGGNSKTGDMSGNFSIILLTSTILVMAGLLTYRRKNN